MRRKLAIIFWLALLPDAAMAAKHDAPRSIEDVPLTECTPTEVLGSMPSDSLQREADNAKQSLHQLEQLRTLMDSLPPGHPNEPIANRMTPAQAAAFERLATQIRIHQFNHLAESHLQRDIGVIGQAVTAIEKLRRAAPDLKSESDPEGNGAGLVGLLRKFEDGTTLDSNNPTGTCSLDFALAREQRIVISEATALLKSPERRAWDELKIKYKVTEQLDPKLLPSPDREKAEWLIKALIEPTARNRDAVQDYEYLRRFATASSLEYADFSDDIIVGAGAEDYDYDTAIKKVYATAQFPMQRAIDAWGVINQNIPAQAMKEAEELAKIAHPGAR